MIEKPFSRKFGWRRDLPDFRDFTVNHNQLSARLVTMGNQEPVKAMLKKTGITKSQVKKLPAKVDLRKWCSPIEHQGNIGSCTAQAGVGPSGVFREPQLQESA